MKTSLIIDNRVYEDAKKESASTGQSLSEIINQWAILGRDLWKTHKKRGSAFKPIDLGRQKTDLSSRKDWMEALEDDRS